MRGDRNSPERNADLASLQRSLREFRQANIRRPAKGENDMVAMAPYLLYASLLDTEADVIRLRKRLFLEWRVRPDEILFTTTDFCGGMGVELYHTTQLQLPQYVIGENDPTPLLLVSDVAEAAE